MEAKRRASPKLGTSSFASPWSRHCFIQGRCADFDAQRVTRRHLAQGCAFLDLKSEILRFDYLFHKKRKFWF